MATFLQDSNWTQLAVLVAATGVFVMRNDELLRTAGQGLKKASLDKTCSLGTALVAVSLVALTCCPPAEDVAAELLSLQAALSTGLWMALAYCTYAFGTFGANTTARSTPQWRRIGLSPWVAAGNAVALSSRMYVNLRDEAYCPMGWTGESVYVALEGMNLACCLYIFYNQIAERAMDAHAVATAAEAFDFETVNEELMKGSSHAERYLATCSWAQVPAAIAANVKPLVISVLVAAAIAKGHHLELTLDGFSDKLWVFSIVMEALAWLPNMFERHSLPSWVFLLLSAQRLCSIVFWRDSHVELDDARPKAVVGSVVLASQWVGVAVVFCGMLARQAVQSSREKAAEKQAARMAAQAPTMLHQAPVAVPAC